MDNPYASIFASPVFTHFRYQIGAFIINQNNFYILKRLADETVHATIKILFHVVTRNNY